MMYPDLVAYIRDQTQEGISAESLRQILMEAGWRDLDIENALHDVAAGLHPVTAGASIHEDLAQVRGMVAHLATRVKTLEARLATVGALPMQQELPTAQLPMLPVFTPRQHFLVRHLVSLLVGSAAFAGLYVCGSRLAGWLHMVPKSQATALVAVGVALLLIAYSAMRMHKKWAASVLTGLSVGILALTMWRAYRMYHIMEISTAIALGVLLAVLLVVMERWNDRLAR